MGERKVERTNGFDNALKPIKDKGLKVRISKQIEKVIANPEIGKPMMNARKGTREVYVSPFRLSYSHDKEKDILYLLEVYHKDEQ